MFRLALLPSFGRCPQAGFLLGCCFAFFSCIFCSHHVIFIFFYCVWGGLVFSALVRYIRLSGIVPVYFLNCVIRCIEFFILFFVFAVLMSIQVFWFVCCVLCEDLALMGLFFFHVCW